MPSVQRAAKLVKLKPYKIPVVHALHQPDPSKRLQFCNCVLEKINWRTGYKRNCFLMTRRGFIYMDRCVHKIIGITVTEKQRECLGAAV